MHCFLAELATVTFRLHVRYRVPGLWKVETTGLWGLRCIGKGTEAGWESERSELASHSLPGSATQQATQAAEQSDNSPNAGMCHVTVVSQPLSSAACTISYHHWGKIAWWFLNVTVS